jgi:protein gp37
MAINSAIEWTESTWNPVTGCTEISAGCRNCYAKRMARRLQAMGQDHYRNGFKPTCHPELLDLPFQWKKPQMIFVNSMSDLFHDKVSVSFIDKVFDVMTQTQRHTYQVLTKRAKRLAELSPRLNWPNNVWAGVTVESSDYKYRINYLRKIESHIRFLSLEPLLDDIGELDLTNIDWVIVGGESGPGARSIHADWVRNIRNQCLDQNVPFFFKQWGGFFKKKNGRLLDGRVWNQTPQKVREYANV